jgi:hypothetical protein
MQFAFRWWTTIERHSDGTALEWKKEPKEFGPMAA